MFPNDLWIADPNEGRLYKVENDVVKSNIHVEKEARSVLVSQDMTSVYTVNRSSNTVSHFSQGEHIKDITVGKVPWGICEDSNKAIYVSNYKDGTISKISKDGVIATYDVEAGPQGIICDDNDNVYVACSLSNTVVRIVNGVKVDSIEVGLNPQGITCDPFGNIWTANYGSNTISKITNGFKILDIEVGKGPIAIVSDSSGSIYVANYLSDNVTLIGNGGKEEPKTIPVGDGPTAISVNKEDAIYVTSGLGEDVKKIVNGSVIASIPVCANPSAFGDFTGCSTYNIYNITQGTSVGTPEGGWKITDLELSAQNAINKVNSGNVETISENVEYRNDSFPDLTDVEEALNKLFEEREPETFKWVNVSIDKYEEETGTNITTLTVNWEFSGEQNVTSIDIKNEEYTLGTVEPEEDEIIPSKGSKTLTGISITENASIKLVANIDDLEQKESISLPIVFKDKFLYGAIDANTEPDDDSLEDLVKSELGESIIGKVLNINCSVKNYPIFAIPEEQTINCIYTFGIVNNNWKEYTIPHTNNSSGTKNYKIYILENPVKTDKFILEIK